MSLALGEMGPWGSPQVQYVAEQRRRVQSEGGKRKGENLSKDLNCVTSKRTK